MDVQNLPIAQIRANKAWNSRQHPAAPGEKDAADAALSLSEDIAKRGLISPITVRKVEPSGKARYEVVVGFRRFEACRLAKLETIPAIIFEGSEAEARLLNLRENLQRKDLTTYDLAVQCRALKEEHKMSGAEVSEAIGKDRNYVNLLVARLQKLHPSILEAWEKPSHPAHPLCNTENLNKLTAMAEDGQLAHWDKLRGVEATPAAPAADGTTPTPQEPATPPVKRPSNSKLAEAMAALDAFDADDDGAKVARQVLRFCMGTAKTLRVGKVMVYDPARKAAKDEGSEDSE